MLIELSEIDEDVLQVLLGNAYTGILYLDSKLDIVLNIGIAIVRLEYLVLTTLILFLAHLLLILKFLNF